MSLSDDIAAAAARRWERLFAKVDTFTDEQLAEKWRKAGERLFVEDREQFYRVYDSTLHRHFVGVPASAETPTLDSWNRLASMMKSSPEARRIFGVYALGLEEDHAGIDEARKVEN